MSSGPAAIQLSPGLWRVPTTPADLVNSYVVAQGDGRVTLIDTGFRKTPTRILAALSQLGRAPQDVAAIVLTHAHADHAGGAAALVTETGRGITVHGDDAAYVQDGTSPPRDQAYRLGRMMRWGDAPAPAAPVEARLADGQLLEESGLQVVHTPGHTPGHVSLLHRPSGTLITGDSIWNMFSRRTWPVLAFCTSAAQNEQTAARLADLEYTTAAFTHGPEIRGTGREAVRAFLAHPRRFGLRS